MKQEFKPLTWKVKNYFINKNEIWDYDVLEYREDQIKKLKKKCPTKEEFAEAMRREMMWQYWSRCEYEVIIEVDDNNRVWLSPWVGCRNPEEVKIDVTDDIGFDWYGFAKYHIGKQIYKDKAKIDVFDQLQWKWDKFIDCCWNYRHKWQRRKNMRFKNFEIRKCTFIGDPPTPDYHKWNFDLVKWAEDNSHCWSIGHLEWNRREPYFEFRSVGTRYLKHREDGLEEWLLRWCELKEVEYRYEEE